MSPGCKGGCAAPWPLLRPAGSAVRTLAATTRLARPGAPCGAIEQVGSRQGQHHACHVGSTVQGARQVGPRQETGPHKHPPLPVARVAPACGTSQLVNPALQQLACCAVAPPCGHTYRQSLASAVVAVVAGVRPRAAFRALGALWRLRAGSWSAGQVQGTQCSNSAIASAIW